MKSSARSFEEFMEKIRKLSGRDFSALLEEDEKKYPRKCRGYLRVLQEIAYTRERPFELEMVWYFAPEEMHRAMEAMEDGAMKEYLQKFFEKHPKAEMAWKRFQQIKNEFQWVPYPVAAKFYKKIFKGKDFAVEDMQRETRKYLKKTVEWNWKSRLREFFKDHWKGIAKFTVYALLFTYAAYKVAAPVIAEALSDKVTKIEFKDVNNNGKTDAIIHYHNALGDHTVVVLDPTATKPYQEVQQALQSGKDVWLGIHEKHEEIGKYDIDGDGNPEEVQVISNSPDDKYLVGDFEGHKGYASDIEALDFAIGSNEFGEYDGDKDIRIVHGDTTTWFYYGEEKQEPMPEWMEELIVWGGLVFALVAGGILTLRQESSPGFPYGEWLRGE